MHNLTISEQIKALRAKEFSAVELVQHYLNRIEKYKHLNAFISTDPENALLRAKQADKQLATGDAPELCGIPMAHKDIFCTENLPTTCGSKMLESFISPYPATIVQRLINNQSIMLGKTNLDEFAMGSTGETSYYGATLNPWNTKHVPGGSSSGSAAAVAARIVPFATTTDTGGSTRQPAAFCGLSGIKPTYGLIPRTGQIAYASSFDQAGIVTTNIKDLAITTQVIAGFDPHDSTTINRPVANFSQDIDKPINGMKIGLPKCIYASNLADDVKQAIDVAIKVYKELGAEIREIDLNLIHAWLPAYQTLACAEASANLARYDGVRFGYQAQNTKSIDELIIKSRTEGFGEEVRNRILSGTFALTSSTEGNYYYQAQKVRKLITDELTNNLKDLDAILLPSAPSEAYKLGESQSKNKQYKLGDTYTVSANLAGLPAISFQAGISKNQLPLGIQLLGNYLAEPVLFQLANAFQKATNWHTLTPSLEETA